MTNSSIGPEPEDRNGTEEVGTEETPVVANKEPESDSSVGNDTEPPSDVQDESDTTESEQSIESDEDDSTSVDSEDESETDSSEAVQDKAEIIEDDSVDVDSNDSLDNGENVTSGTSVEDAPEQTEDVIPEETVDESPKSVEDTEEKASDEKPLDKNTLLMLSGWGVAGFALLAILGLGSYSGAHTTVPQAPVTYSADNENFEKDACKEFNDAKIKCEVVTVNTYDVPAGNLVKQSSPAGSRVKKNSSVQIAYSLGPKFGEMPDIKGLPIDEATDALAKQGVKVGQVTEVDNSGQVKGHVVGSNVRTGSVTDNGDVVNLTVSSGKIITPDFEGLSVDQALKTAADAGIDAKINWVEGNEPYGVISAQSSAKDSELKGGTITLDATKPYDGQSLQIPEVEGEKQDDAVQKLNESGITNLNIVEVQGKSDKVLSVSPSESQYVSPSQVVTVVVSSPDADD